MQNMLKVRPNRIICNGIRKFGGTTSVEVSATSKVFMDQEHKWVTHNYHPIPVLFFFSLEGIFLNFLSTWFENFHENESIFHLGPSLTRSKN